MAGGAVPVATHHSDRISCSLDFPDSYEYINAVMYWSSKEKARYEQLQIRNLESILADISCLTLLATGVQFMPHHRPEIYDEDDNWLSRKWWQKEFPPSTHRRMRIIEIAFVIGMAVTAANVAYVLLF